jgi:large subunit ribosomal protein L22
MVILQRKIKLLKSNITTQLKYARISPIKVRPVMDKVRMKSVLEAKRFLNFDSTKAARIILKALNSASANAKQKSFNEKDLIISYISADGGPVLKRGRAGSKGRPAPILKRTSHINIVLSEQEAK